MTLLMFSQPDIMCRPKYAVSGIYHCKIGMKMEKERIEPSDGGVC